MRVRIPRDQPTLAAALATGADQVEIDGTIELPEGAAGALLDRPVHIRGGTLRARGDWALVIGADVVLSGVVVENETGNGLRIVAGAPVLEQVELRVKGVAGLCEGSSKPVLRRVVVDGAENGWLLREDTAPDADELAVRASGSALVITDRARGHLARLALVSGDRFACVEAHGQCGTLLSGLTVLSAGCGALHIFGESKLRVDGAQIRSAGTADARFPAIEVREDAAPTLASVAIEQTAGAGLLLHGRCEPLLQSVTVGSAGGHGLEARGEALLDLTGLCIREAGASGLVLSGTVEARLAEVVCAQAAEAGVRLGGRSRVELRGLELRHAAEVGLEVCEQARGVVRQASLTELSCVAVRVAADGHLTADKASIVKNGDVGICVADQASLVLRRSTVSGNAGQGVAASGETRLRLAGVLVEENGAGDLFVTDRAELRWSGGALPGRVVREHAGTVVVRPPQA